jgi:hypothetical protein
LSIVFGNGDHRDPLLVETEAVRQRVVTADGDEHVEFRRFQHWEHIVGEIVGSVSRVTVAEECGETVGCHLRRIGPRRVQEGPSGAVDGPDHARIQCDQVLLEAGPVFRVGFDEPTPATADPDHIVTFVGDPVDHCLDTGVQAGDVAATGEDANTH